MSFKIGFHKPNTYFTYFAHSLTFLAIFMRFPVVDVTCK